ncbi:MAG: Eco47II family restriction endonuclease [Fastidiosipilaceae bacterium]|jgi:hypothetical protein
MEWTIKFLSESDFKKHVTNTIENYGAKLVPYDVKKFNHNIIDPVKMIFDKAVYGVEWEQIISNEIFRQRDKSNSNEIGYFHQKIFKYIDRCEVPDTGWDVIFEPKEGYQLDDKNTVHTIYTEVKNKHNTMNSSSSGKTYIKMQNQLLSDDDCVCMLVEAIAKQSQNIVWSTTLDGTKVSHTRIRRVSIDKFYELVTGEADAFLQICRALPSVVKEVLESQDSSVISPEDIVYKEIKSVASDFEEVEENKAMILSMYMLGFSTYNGFANIFKKKKNNDEKL